MSTTVKSAVWKHDIPIIVIIPSELELEALVSRFLAGTAFFLFLEFGLGFWFCCLWCAGPAERVSKKFEEYSSRSREDTYMRVAAVATLLTALCPLNSHKDHKTHGIIRAFDTSVSDLSIDYQLIPSPVGSVNLILSTARRLQILE